MRGVICRVKGGKRGMRGSICRVEGLGVDRTTRVIVFTRRLTCSLVVASSGFDFVVKSVDSEDVATLSVRV